jgi:hypothetical protein
MVTEPRMIHIAPDSELAKALEMMAQPVVIESGGKHYRLMREEADAAWADYDPEAAAAGIRAAAGSWSKEYAEQMKAHLYRAREEGTRPADRP